MITELQVLSLVASLIWGYLLYLHIKNRRKYSDEKTNTDIENRVIILENENKGLYENVGALNVLLSSKDKDLTDSTRKVEELQAKLVIEEENNQKILSMKKSSEIRTGYIAEQLAPFLEGFQHDPRNIRYLGNPVDYIVFGKDKITFVEVKSGKSHLSHNQKNIRRLVEDKKVEWQDFRVKGNREWRQKKRKR